MNAHCIQRGNQDVTCYCGFCCGDVCMMCVVAATSSAVCQMWCGSAQTLLLAYSFELHLLITLSPMLLPWKPNHHTHDTGYNTAVYCFPHPVPMVSCSPETHELLDHCSNNQLTFVVVFRQQAEQYIQ